jgi:hypothetical protein
MKILSVDQIEPFHAFPYQAKEIANDKGVVTTLIAAEMSVKTQNISFMQK